MITNDQTLTITDKRTKQITAFKLIHISLHLILHFANIYKVCYSGRFSKSHYSNKKEDMSVCKCDSLNPLHFPQCLFLRRQNTNELLHCYVPKSVIISISRCFI